MNHYLWAWRSWYRFVWLRINTSRHHLSPILSFSIQDETLAVAMKSVVASNVLCIEGQKPSLKQIRIVTGPVNPTEWANAPGNIRDRRKHAGGNTT
jgi:hypothetical protein